MSSKHAATNKRNQTSDPLTSLIKCNQAMQKPRGADCLQTFADAVRAAAGREASAISVDPHRLECLVSLAPPVPHGQPSEMLLLAAWHAPEASFYLHSEAKVCDLRAAISLSCAGTFSPGAIYIKNIHSCARVPQHPLNVDRPLDSCRDAKGNLHLLVQANFPKETRIYRRALGTSSSSPQQPAQPPQPAPVGPARFGRCQPPQPPIRKAATPRSLHQSPVTKTAGQVRARRRGDVREKHSEGEEEQQQQGDGEGGSESEQQAEQEQEGSDADGEEKQRVGQKRGRGHTQQAGATQQQQRRPQQQRPRKRRRSVIPRELTVKRGQSAAIKREMESQARDTRFPDTCARSESEQSGSADGNDSEVEPPQLPTVQQHMSPLVNRRLVASSRRSGGDGLGSASADGTGGKQAMAPGKKRKRRRTVIPASLK